MVRGVSLQWWPLHSSNSGHTLCPCFFPGALLAWKDLACLRVPMGGNTLHLRYVHTYPSPLKYCVRTAGADLSVSFRKYCSIPSCYLTWSTVAPAWIHRSILNREIHPLIFSVAVCIEVGFKLSTACCLWRQWPALTVAVGTSLCCSRCCCASVGDGRGDKVSAGTWPCTDSNKMSVSECVSQRGLPIGSAVKDGKCVKFCKGLKNQIFGTLLLIWTPPSPENLSYLCLRVSYTHAELLRISFYRPSPVWIEN